MNPATANIEEAILSAILAGRINPGTRLGEQKLADLFGVSRTRVREAMMRLETRGVVQVSARRGWYVVEPSAEEAREAFQTRRVIETGLLHSLREVPPDVLKSLKEHVAMERDAIGAGDVHSRACLLGDFHIHLADALGNRMLTEIIRDLTARNPPKKPEIKFLIKNSPCFIGLNKNEPALLAKVNEIIAGAKKDGALDAIAQKWLGASLPKDL